MRSIYLVVLVAYVIVLAPCASARADTATASSGQSLSNSAVVVPLLSLLSAIIGGLVTIIVEWIRTSPRTAKLESRMEKAESTLLKHDKNLTDVIADVATLRTSAGNEARGLSTQMQEQQRALDELKSRLTKDETDFAKRLKSRKQQDGTLEKMEDRLARDEKKLNRVIANEAAVPRLITSEAHKLELRMERRWDALQSKVTRQDNARKRPKDRSAGTRWSNNAVRGNSKGNGR